MSEERFDDVFDIVDDSGNHVPDVPINNDVLESAVQSLLESDEIAAQNKEELEQLESPLIVHKDTDASYQETASDISMEETHNDDDAPTLERHRFRKEPKKKGKGIKFVLLLIVICCAVFAGVYASHISENEKSAVTTSAHESTSETTTSIQQAYEGKIVIKGTYIFVDGVEVDGIQGLQDALKYEEPSQTRYEIVKENANADFLNNGVLPLLTDMNFYGEKTVISTIVKTGLVAEEETTTKKTTKKSKKKKTKETTDKQQSENVTQE